MSNTDNFDSFYETKLLKTLTELEEIRLSYIKKFKIFLYIGLAFIIPLIISIFLKLTPLVIFVFAFISFIFFSIAYSKYDSLKKLLGPYFKKRIIFPILKHLYKDIEYLPLQKISSKVLNPSLLITQYVYKTSGDDYVRCKIGKTKIQFSEVEASAGGAANAGAFYSGIFIQATFNKSFKSKTIVLPESLGSKALLYSSLYKRQMKNAAVIKLEDPEFEKEFHVIGEDQVESRYLLSTSLMHRLFEYEKRFQGKVSFSFVDNRLNISIPILGNMFEARVFEPITNKEYIKYNYEYFKLITDVVKDLDLNNRIWL